MTFLRIDDETISLAEKGFTAYCGYLENMNAKNVRLGARHFDKDARYVAPLIDVGGREDIINMLAVRPETYSDYNFKITHVFWDENGQTVFVRWIARYSDKGRKIVLSGMGEITFTLRGLVLSHTDYYDALPELLQKNKWLAWFWKPKITQ